jgi:hypothetical protein
MPDAPIRCADKRRCLIVERLVYRRPNEASKIVRGLKQALTEGESFALADHVVD